MKNKIKIIDILCYISIGDFDKVPKKVKALDEIWIYDEIAECHKNKDCVRLYKRLDEFYILTDWLNFEVEIIEEPETKEIEKLELESGDINDKTFLAFYITHNRYKINELIDEINQLKRGE